MASVPVRRLSRDLKRQRVHDRVRMKVSGTSERPRLCVYRSLDHIYAQIIDDRAGKTLAAATLPPPCKFFLVPLSAELAATSVLPARSSMICA